MTIAVLASTTITTAVTGTTSTAIDLPANIRNLTVQCNFTYGSGGTTAKFWVQTSFDKGTTWVDIANFAHTTASLNRVYNLSSSTAVTTVYTVTDAALADNTCKDGLIGDRIRVKYTTTGTYAGGTTVAVNAYATTG